MKSEAPQLKALITCLQDRHHSAYLPAVQALVQVGPEAVPAMIKALSYKNNDVRMGVALALKQSRSLDALPALMNCWQDSDGNVRQVAKQAIASLGEQAVIPVVERLQTQAENEREFVCEVLQEMAYNGSITNGFGPYLYECDRETKLFLIELMGICGAAGSIHHLINLASTGVREETDPINVALLNALSNIVTDSALFSLLEYLPITSDVEDSLAQFQQSVSQTIARWRATHPGGAPHIRSLISAFCPRNRSKALTLTWF